MKAVIHFLSRSYAVKTLIRAQTAPQTEGWERKRKQSEVYKKMGVEGKIKAENSPGGRDFIKAIGSLGSKFDCALTLYSSGFC